VAAVEFALVAIPFFIMVLGMIEIGRGIMVQQMLTNASREGARLGVLDGTTVQNIQNTVKSYLPSLPTNGGLQIQVNPGSTYPSGYGEPVTVRVSIPFSEVSWLPVPNYLGGTTLSATTVMRRETVQ